MGKNKERKGKSKSTNGGQSTGPSVYTKVRYEPKATTSAPKKELLMNTTLLQLLDFSIHDLYWFFHKVEFVIESKLFHWNDKGFFICHWANPFKDFERSNLPRVKLSLFSKSDDTFTSLQALSNLHYLFSGFMDYFLSLPESGHEITVMIRDDRYWHSMPGDYFLYVKSCKVFHTICLSGKDEMCGFGEAIDNDPDCVKSV
ncbi:hypothetical protein Tco_0275983 [Tanacetum coccineum]